MKHDILEYFMLILICVLIFILFAPTCSAGEYKEVPPTAAECVEQLKKYDESFVRHWHMSDYDKEREGLALKEKGFDTQCAPYVDIK